MADNEPQVDEETRYLFSIDKRLRGNYSRENVEPEQSTGGLGWPVTSTYITALTTGAGLLVLPKAVAQAGPTAFGLFAVFALVSIYSGHILGKCLLLARQRCSITLQAKLASSPYPTITQIAFGPNGSMTFSWFVSFCVNMSLFAIAVICILLASENISKLLPDDSNVKFCTLVLIFGCGSILLLTLCRSLRIIWFKLLVGIACLTTCMASVMICILVSTDDKPAEYVSLGDVTFWSFFTSIGTLCFAFGGHAVFPTFQVDMLKPRHFSKSVIAGYIAVLIIYLPPCITTYIKYGNRLPSNLMEIIIQHDNEPYATIVSVCVSVHLLLCTVIVLNPVCWDVERFFSLKHETSIKTIICRVLIVAVTVFMALSIPHFSNIISIVGGSTMAILQFVAPTILFMKLCRIRPTGTEAHWGRLSVPIYLSCCNYEIAIIGCAVAILATIASIRTMTEDFSSPCYLKFTQNAPL